MIYIKKPLQNTVQIIACTDKKQMGFVPSQKEKDVDEYTDYPNISAGRYSAKCATDKRFKDAVHAGEDTCFDK